MEDEKNQKKVILTIAGGIVLLILTIVLILIGRAAQKEGTADQKEEVQEVSSSTDGVDDEKMYEIDLDTVIEKEDQETEKTDIRKPTEAKEEKYPRIKKEKDGREYTPYAKKEKWEGLSEEEKAAMTEELIPVLQDKNKTIDRICTSSSRPELEPYSYVLASFLRTYCQEEGIQARKGMFLAYAGWVSEEKEQIYIELDDADQTILLATAKIQGRSWEFEQVEGTREEVLKQARKNEEYADDIPAKTAESKTKTE
jgi:hypothetical protein